MSELLDCNVLQLRDRIGAGEVSAEETCRAFLDRIEAVEERVGAFTVVLRDEAIEAARAADRRIAAGESAGSLAGVPVAVKDLLCTRGVPTTCASRMLENFRPTYDATVVTRLRRAGAVVVGKTNMDEFAMGSSTENSAFHTTRNPWDLERVPGGSSGGSAAALASGGVPAALGSDTGGSIRQPAALCGVVGLKPTWGRVSRYGLVAFASSLDQVGPMGRTVADCAALLGEIAGPDPNDATCSGRPVPDYVAALGDGAQGLRIGMPEEYFPAGLDAGIRGSVEAALRQMEQLGATVEPVSLPHTDYAIATYYILATAEASSNLARYDGVRYGVRREPEDRAPGGIVGMYRATRSAGFGAEVQRRIMLGTYVLSAGYYDAYYLKAQKVRTLIEEDFRRAFEKVDLICSPTTPSPAFRLGEKIDDPMEMYLSDVFTATINLAGLPGLSLPCGLSATGLPIGFQIVGRPFEEKTILRAAAALERALDFHRPVLPAAAGPPPPPEKQ